MIELNCNISFLNKHLEIINLLSSKYIDLKVSMLEKDKLEISLPLFSISNHAADLGSLMQAIIKAFNAEFPHTHQTLLNNNGFYIFMSKSEK